jgi:hypothetical protein
MRPPVRFDKDPAVTVRFVARHVAVDVVEQIRRAPRRELVVGVVRRLGHGQWQTGSGERPRGRRAPSVPGHSTFSKGGKHLGLGLNRFPECVLQVSFEVLDVRQRAESP